MSDDEAVELWARVAQARVARLATTAADGAVHLVPMVFVLLGDTVYSAVDGKPKTTRRLRRLRDIEQTGRASVLVDHYGEDWDELWWVRLTGDAEVLAGDSAEGVRAIDALVAKYPQYERVRPEGPVIALRVERRQSWSARNPKSC